MYCLLEMVLVLANSQNIPEKFLESVNVRMQVGWVKNMQELFLDA